MHFKDITGKRFGKLIALKVAKKDKGRIHWLFECDCGNKVIRRGKSVQKATMSSCGCYRYNLAHGLSKSKLYCTWAHLKGRTQCKTDKRYPLYGGRGIKCIWKSFSEFKNDMFDAYLEHVKNHGERNTTLDRIDTNGHYCKENCRWATWKEQQGNRRNTRVLEYKGKKWTYGELIDLFNSPLKRKQIELRIRRQKWPIEKAFTQPVRPILTKRNKPVL